MDQNVTFFGDVADDFDTQTQQAEQILDEWVESSNYSIYRMVGASITIAFMRFGQSFVDTLRLGNGLKQGGWRGIGTDTMRLLTVTGVAGATISRLSKILVVTQQAGTMTCSWVTTVNALQRTGQRFFASMEQLAQAAGVDLAAVAREGTTVQGLRNLIDALKKLGIAIEDVSAPTQKLETILDLLKARVAGALAFGIEYENGTRVAFHRIFAMYSKLDGLVITDTTGKIYRSFDALRAVYTNARISATPLYFLKNTAIVIGAEYAATVGGLKHLVVELLPLVLKGQAQSATAPQRRN